MTKPSSCLALLAAAAFCCSLFPVTEAIFDPVTITLGAGAASIIGLKLVALKAGVLAGVVAPRLKALKYRNRFNRRRRFGRSVPAESEDEIIQIMILKASLEDSQDCAKKLVSKSSTKTRKRRNISH